MDMLAAAAKVAAASACKCNQEHKTASECVVISHEFFP